MENGTKHSHRLITAAKKKDAEEISICLAEGVDQLSLNDSLFQMLNASRKLLLGAGADPAVGANGTSPLELVLNRTAPVEVVELLIDHGAHGIFLSEQGIRKQNIALDLAARMPQAFKHMLDHGVRFCGGGDSIQLDWRYIIYDDQARELGTSWRRGESEAEFLHTLILDSPRSSTDIILTHPLIACFVGLKHNTWVQYIIALATLLFYMVTLWILYVVECPSEAPSDKNTTAASGPEEEDPDGHWNRGDGETRCEIEFYYYVMAYVALLGFVCTHAWFEVQSMRALGVRSYFKQWQRYASAAASVLLILTLSPFLAFWNSPHKITWHYSTAALSMVIAAVHFMAQAAPFSFIDLYAEILSGVFWKFTKTVAAVAPLLFGFFVGFKVLQSDARSQAVHTFDFLTMVVSNNAEYEELKDSGKGWIYNAGSYVFFGAFMILILVVLLNFLVGLAVSDVQDLQNSAEIAILRNRIRHLYVTDAIRSVYRRTLTSGLQGRRFTHEISFHSSPAPGASLNFQLLELARKKPFSCTDKQDFSGDLIFHGAQPGEPSTSIA